MNNCIQRRSLRERKKKTYKDDFDYNLSEEEDGGNAKAAAAGGEMVKSETGELEPGALPVAEEIPIQEENLTVEKILALRTDTNVCYKNIISVWYYHDTLHEGCSALSDSTSIIAVSRCFYCSLLLLQEDGFAQEEFLVKYKNQ